LGVFNFFWVSLIEKHKPATTEMEHKSAPLNRLDLMVFESFLGDKVGVAVKGKEKEEISWPTVN
jgi:hypothetical protein